MPDINKLPVPQYDPGHPYHWEYDNLPLDVLKDRDELINSEVDNHGKILREANGNQGTLSNRLNQSINEDGSLKASSIDEALHNIAEHTDGSKTVDASELDTYTDTLGYASVSNPVAFVRMLEAERDKLARIADEATNMTIEVETPSNIVLFEEGPLRLAPSDSVQWQITAPNIVKAVLSISTDFAHRHFYDLEPITTDYENYKVTSVNTPYIEDSLRVIVNGIRLNSEYEVYVPSNPIGGDWTLNMFTPDHDAGTFVLSRALSASDIIRIDFDVSLT